MKNPNIKKEDTDYEKKIKAIAEHNDRFKRNYSPMLKAWMESHPREPAPVIQDEDGKMYWQSRKERRRMASKKYQKKVK